MLFIIFWEVLGFQLMKSTKMGESIDLKWILPIFLRASAFLRARKVRQMVVLIFVIYKILSITMLYNSANNEKYVYFQYESLITLLCILSQCGLVLVRLMIVSDTSIKQDRNQSKQWIHHAVRAPLCNRYI